MRNIQLPGRSTVHAMHGMAATSHPLASQTAIAILQQGGNAMDAAIAACAVQCVVEPGSTGIGGDCFALYCRNGVLPVLAYNGSGRAPAGAAADWYAGRGMRAIPPYSAHAVTIPGAVEAWTRLHADHGRLPFATLLAPAIAFAEDGFAVAPVAALSWTHAAARLAQHPGSAAIFLPGGRAPTVGTIHRQPQLAATLHRIARDGAAAFYTGAVADDIVATLRAAGGHHTAADFAGHRGNYVEPIHSTYRGVDVYQVPPNGQGIVALLMLNILQGFDLASLAPHGAERFHLEMEASRLGYAMRDALVADMEREAVPVPGILSDRYAAEMRAAIDPDRAMPLAAPSGFPLHPDTVYLTVVDRDRNAVSFINSLFHSFGSGITAEKSGVLLQNRGAGFVLAEGHPNRLAPGKRPLHTIIPGMAVKDGRVLMPFGVMGGQYQPVGHVHFLTNVIDFGMDLQEALDSPRAWHNGSTLELEAGVAKDTAAGLRERGHSIVFAGPHGGGQAIRIDWQKGTLEGGSDPRKDGCALGY